MTEVFEASSVGWPVWASAATPKDIQKRKPLFDFFCHWMAKNVPSLWSGQSEPGYTQEILENQLSNLLGTESELTTHRVLANWWDLLVAEGHRLKLWRVRPGSQRVKLAPERPAFVRRDFQLLARLRPLEEAFLDRVSGALESTNLYDAFLLSAILNGGVLSFERVGGLLTLRADTVQVMNGALWATLALPVAGSAKASRPVRWYPDALTSTLLIRCLNEGSFPADVSTPPERKAVWARLQAASEHLQLRPWDDGLNDLLRAARVSTALNVPGFVAAFLADDLESHSLPDAVVGRIGGWELPAKEAPSDDAQRPALDDSVPIRLDVSFQPDLPRKSQMVVARDVCKALGENDRVIECLKKILKKNEGGLWPITHALISWTIWRLEPGCPSGAIKASSAETYFRTLALHLVYEAEDIDLLDLEVDDFETLYERAAERVDTEARRAYFWGRLRDFHDFMFRCGAPDVDLRELDGWVSMGAIRVSANLVTENEFGRFKESLNAETDRDAGTMVFLAGMLAYRTGLRRRETQMLRIQDIHPGSEPFLLIRPSRLASLKTNSSKRRIPLRPLLPGDELEALLTFRARRIDQIGSEAGLLFADPSAPWTPLPYGRLIDPVTALFAAITGQVGLPFRFHHLRHSFANWIFIALLAMDEPELLARRLPFLDSHLLSVDRLRLLRECFFPRSAGAESFPDRRHLYQVAALMGHLSPTTTCQSYLHLLDWQSGRYLDLALDHRLQELGAPKLGRLCGLSGSMPYKGLYRDLASSPTGFMRHYVAVHGRAHELKNAPVGEPEKLPRLRELIKSSLPRPAVMVTLLRRHFSGATFEKLEQTFAVSASAIEAAANAYQHMYAKQSVQTPKLHFKFPRPPRTRSDQREYFRILGHAVNSAAKPQNRPALIAVAEALIQRTGPRTGQIYFGTKGRDVELILKGLVLLGIDGSEMMLVVRRPAELADSPDYIVRATELAKSMGISTAVESLKWGKREMKSVLLRLDVKDTSRVVEEKALHWEGRVRGLNHAAAWIRMVESLACF
jgi:integrase